jgi:putative oxidoreductase
MLRRQKGPAGRGQMTEIAAAPPRSRSQIPALIDKLVRLCAVIPYALVALGLRLIMARIFFISGQEKIEGPVVPLGGLLGELDVSVTLPADIKSTTLQMFETQYAELPIPPTVAAYLFSYAEFVLPICLLLGFASRFAALALLVMTLLMQLYALPAMWWPAHVYWVAILAVLISVGPGAISIDALIRYVYSRDKQADSP